MNQSCGECIFFDGAGECHLHPPVRLPRKFSAEADAGNRVREEDLIWGWPTVRYDDWCGQYRGRM